MFLVNKISAFLQSNFIHDPLYGFIIELPIGLILELNKGSTVYLQMYYQNKSQ